MPLAVETIGIGETFTTIQAWEDALANDIQHTGECKAEVFARVKFDGVVYTATEYPLLTSVDGAEHDGRAHEVSGAGNARIESIAASHCIYIRDDYVRVSWLEIKGPGDNASVNGIYIDFVLPCTSAIHHCIIHNNRAATVTDLIYGIYVKHADVSVRIYRNIIYGYEKYNIDVEACTDITSVVLCNTICYATNRGLRNYVANVPVESNAFFENAGLDIHDVTGVLDYNATSDASGAEGPNRIFNQVTADQFVNPTDTWGDTDLTIKAGADLIDAGTDFNPATYPEIDHPITDRDNPIIGTWDIGADEFPSVTTTSSTEPPTTSTLPPTTSTEPPTSSTEPPTSSTEPPTSSTEPPTTSTEPPATTTEPPTTTTRAPYRMLVVGIQDVGETSELWYVDCRELEDVT